MRNGKHRQHCDERNMFRCANELYAKIRSATTRNVIAGICQRSMSRACQRSSGRPRAERAEPAYQSNQHELRLYPEQTRDRAAGT